MVADVALIAVVVVAAATLDLWCLPGLCRRRSGVDFLNFEVLPLDPGNVHPWVLLLACVRKTNTHRPSCFIPSTLVGTVEAELHRCSDVRPDFHAGFRVYDVVCWPLGCQSYHLLRVEGEMNKRPKRPYPLII